MYFNSGGAPFRSTERREKWSGPPILDRVGSDQDYFSIHPFPELVQVFGLRGRFEIGEGNAGNCAGRTSVIDSDGPFPRNWDRLSLKHQLAMIQFGIFSGVFSATRRAKECAGGGSAGLVDGASTIS